ncbi:hypothetical protein Tco_1499119 [Tanacetum coccineum]
MTKSVTIQRGDTKNFSYKSMESVNKGSTLLSIALVRNISEILGFSELTSNEIPTPNFEPIVDTTSPPLLIRGIDDAECDLEKDILLLEAMPKFKLALITTG